MRNETLNESIDRVAASLTAVPHDRRFSARLNERLDGVPSSWFASEVFTASRATMSAVAALVLLVVGLQLARNERAPVDSARAVAGVEQPRQRETLQASVAASPVVAQLARRTARPSPQVVSESPVPAIAALPAPETLKVNELTLESLTIAPVELELLDLANLEVREIDIGGETKEQE